MPDYAASSWGRIVYVGSSPRGGSPTPGVLNGSRYIWSYRGKSYLVSRWICEAFHGPAPEGQDYCLHKDDNTMNNKPENLKWGTQKENLNTPKFLDYCRARSSEDVAKKPLTYATTPKDPRKR